MQKNVEGSVISNEFQELPAFGFCAVTLNDEHTKSRFKES